jgi:heptosyltransferase-2
VRTIDPAQIGTLLIRGTNWIGDAVMATPALRAIRRTFSQARISLLVRPWVRDVYSAVDFVDEVLVYDKEGIHRGWSGHIRLVGSLKSRHFDMAILLQNAFAAALIAWCARIPRRVGYARDARSLLLTHPVRVDPEVRKAHQSYYYLGILSALGLFELSGFDKVMLADWSRIGVLPEHQVAASNMLCAAGIQPGELIIGINPGAHYGGAKRWLSERYAAVADSLVASHGAKIVIFGSSGERRIAEEIAVAMKSTPVVLAGQTTVGHLMGLIKECRLIITNDSGPMHLAAALDVPQLALFGSTDEIATGPLSRKAQVLKHQVDCNPCLLRECPLDFRCMTGLTVDRVLAAAEAKLRGV